MHGQASAPQVGAVDDVVVDQCRGVDEFDDRRVEHGAIAGVAAQPRRHQQHRGAHALPAALLNVASHLGDQRDPRLNVAMELPLDGVEVFADGLENLREIAGGCFLRCVAQRDADGERVSPQYWTFARSVNALSRCRQAN